VDSLPPSMRENIMPNLFWRTKDGRILNLAETPFKSEDEFERYVYSISGLLSEIFVLSRQVKTSSRKDIPDIVGVDEEGNVVIIELKNQPVNEDIIPQVLRYAIWAETNPDSIRALWLEAKEVPEDVDIRWDSLTVRIVVMAPVIPASVLRLVNKINYQVDLLEVQRFTSADGHEFILVNKREPEKLPVRKLTKGTPEYNKAFYKKHHNNQSVERFFETLKHIDRLVEEYGWTLEKKFNKSYVGYKHGFFNVFGVTWMGSKSFALFFKVPPETAEKFASSGRVPLRYEREWKQVLYKVEGTDLPLDALRPLFEAAYRHIVGSAP